MSFCQEQLVRVKPIWDQMLTHRFLLDTRDGRLPDETFAVWMQQDYLFVEAAIPFMAALITKAPTGHWEALTGAVQALQRELRLFEERARAAGVDLRGVEPSFVNHAYVQFLFATAARGSYAEAYTVLYTAEKAYYDSWSVVKTGLPADSRWYPFVENWAGEGFAGYVEYLRQELDALAAAAGPAERERMAALFELTAKYEIAFWEMAATAQRWPGVR